MRHIPRFYCPDATLQSGIAIILPEPAAHHASVVLRLKDGAAIKLFNAHDGEWEGTCHYAGKRAVTVTLNKQLKVAERLPDAWLVLAPLKNKDSFDNAIRHAVELGVAAIHLVQTATTQQTKLNMDRLRQQAIDAAQQCGRLSVPEIIPVKPLQKLLHDWPVERTLLACVEGHDTIPPLQAKAAAKARQPLAVLIGPEGGFSEAEKATLTSTTHRWLEPVGLGPLILRSDTAVAAALGQLTLNS